MSKHSRFLLQKMSQTSALTTDRTLNLLQSTVTTATTVAVWRFLLLLPARTTTTATTMTAAPTSEAVFAVFLSEDSAADTDAAILLLRLPLPLLPLFFRLSITCADRVRSGKKSFNSS